MHKMAHFVLFI